MNTSYQLGDILVFKAEDDALSKCIAWLTDSDVSHCAMFYTEDSITETIAPGAVTNKIEIGKGEAAYLLRLNPSQDPRPLLNAAQKYIDAGTRYNFPALLYLAGLLLFRKIRPTGKLFFVIEKIMTLACLELDNLLQTLAKHPEYRSTVCSQYVYQVYYDCGVDYQIRIHNGFTNEIIQTPEKIRLFDLCNQNCTFLAASSYTNEKVTESPEELIRQLCKALDPRDISNVISVENLGVPPIVNLFSTKLQKLVDILSTDMPIDSLFVSPADFVYHAENLENIGEILIERIC